jgi:DNA mismatch endonuclease (patch repair protein)
VVDHVPRSKRSEIMRAVRGKDTGPELVVRRALHRAGYRYRLHVKTLPGTPDIVFPSRRKVVFVHGCFWHGHPRCAKARLPKTQVAFWLAKVTLNRKRDQARIEQLKRQGWKVLVVWQCQLKNPQSAFSQLRLFLGE